jgi:hypothetical protein
LKKNILVVVILSLSLLLTGCMFPEDHISQNTIPYQDQLQTVQNAIDQFQKDQGGILPIKTFDQTTPIYHKYPIDFKRLVPEYMTEPPGNAYESGGVFQYVIIDVESNPTVKLYDLRMADLISEINLRIKVQGYPPYKSKIAENIYTLDFEKLGYEEDPYITSPYTNQHLSFVINHKAEVFVDYRPDLYAAIKNKKIDYKTGEDIRDILVEDSPFVPAYSFPYTIDSKTKEPVFLTN